MRIVKRYFSLIDYIHKAFDLHNSASLGLGGEAFYEK